jgi:hypothetical protein
MYSQSSVCNSRFFTKTNNLAGNQTQNLWFKKYHLTRRKAGITSDLKFMTATNRHAHYTHSFMMEYEYCYSLIPDKGLSFFGVNCWWTSPAQLFLFQSPAELTTMFYCLAALGAFKTPVSFRISYTVFH